MSFSLSALCTSLDFQSEIPDSDDFEKALLSKQANAYCGEAVFLVYSMTKAGLMTMTRNLADTLGQEKIRVNQLNVGWTTTPNEIALKIKEGLPDDWYHHVSPTFAPTGKLLTPDNVAEHCLFWMSDKSSPASGCVLEVEQYPLIGRNKITVSSQHKAIA